MPYLTTEQLSMLSDALCLSIFGISVLIIMAMKTKGYGRRLAKKWIRKNGGAGFNDELSLALNDVDFWAEPSEKTGRRPRARRKGFGEKQSKEGYDTARRLAEKGLNVDGIMEKVNLPRNEIELIVKFGRMHLPSPLNRDEQNFTGIQPQASGSATGCIGKNCPCGCRTVITTSRRNNAGFS
jgi:hypothetical protein